MTPTDYHIPSLTDKHICLAVAVFCFYSKTGFWPSYCQISTDLDKSLHIPIVLRNTLVSRLKTAIGTWAAAGQTRTTVFRLGALAKALSVIATATWLGGWLGVCHSRYCIKTTKPIRKFLDHLVGPSFKHLGPLTPIPNSMGNPFIGGVKYTGGGKIGDFRRTSPFISETVRDRPMVTMER